MNETKFAVLVIHHDPDNRNGAWQFMQVTKRLESAEGITRLDGNVYLVDFQQVMPLLAAVYVEQNRFDEFGRCRFSLVPCGNQVFSEHQSVKEKVSAAAGLSLWDMLVPAAQP